MARAFVMAAGLGTRLRPFTEAVPKCLVPIAGRPILAHWLDLLAAHGVEDVLVNTHRHHHQVVEFLARAPIPLRVTVVHEATLLGTAGTLRRNRMFISDSDFFVAYADTLTNADLAGLLATHRRLGKLATLGLFRAPDPRACGIAALDRHGTVVHFEEKPSRPLSDLAFAGLLVGSPELLDELPDQTPCDLAADVFGRLLGRIAGCPMDAYVRDVGTPESYRRAEAEVEHLRLDRP